MSPAGLRLSPGGGQMVSVGRGSGGFWGPLGGGRALASAVWPSMRRVGLGCLRLIPGIEEVEPLDQMSHRCLPHVCLGVRLACTRVVGNVEHDGVLAKTLAPIALSALLGIRSYKGPSGAPSLKRLGSAPVRSAQRRCL